MAKKAAQIEYANRKDFNSRQRAVLDLIISIQKKINALQKKLDPLLTQKKTLSPTILKSLEALGVPGARIGNILIYIQEGKPKDPTFKQLVKKAEKTMSSQFIKKLQQLARPLRRKSADQLKIKTEETKLTKSKSINR